MKFHSTRILILMILCNTAALTGYYFLFQYIKTQNEASSSLTNTINLSQQKNSHLNSLRSVVKDTETERQQLATLLLTSDAEIPFIEQVETLAKGSGLEEKTNSVSSIAGGNSAVKIFQMQIGTTGSWNNTMYFLSQLENLPYNIHVQDLSLGGQAAIATAPVGKTKGLAAPLWSATFDISVTESK